MKVICIDNTNGAEQYLIEGNTYTVIEFTKGANYLGYNIEEVKVSNPFGFKRIRFIPISDINEAELFEQRQNELQTI